MNSSDFWLRAEAPRLLQLAESFNFKELVCLFLVIILFDLCIQKYPGNDKTQRSKEVGVIAEKSRGTLARKEHCSQTGRFWSIVHPSRSPFTLLFSRAVSLSNINPNSPLWKVWIGQKISTWSEFSFLSHADKLDSLLLRQGNWKHTEKMVKQKFNCQLLFFFFFFLFRGLPLVNGCKNKPLFTHCAKKDRYQKAIQDKICIFLKWINCII